MSKFQYDVVTLIELVESKTCLWDKTHEDSKNKVIRDRNWEEIFLFLDERYAEKTVGEKKKTAELIMNKWSNIRDAFLRSLKPKSGQSASKPYLYAQHLQFLLKISESPETASNYNRDSIDDSSLETCPRPKIGSKKRELDEIEREILAEIKKPAVKKSVENDNEMLLLSFSTYIRDMSEEELIEFQMETLNTIRNIKRKRGSAVSSLSPARTISSFPSTSNDLLSSIVTQHVSPSASSSPSPAHTITNFPTTSNDPLSSIVTQHVSPSASSSPSPTHTITNFPTTSNDPLSSIVTQHVSPSASSSPSPAHTITSFPGPSNDVSERIQHSVPPSQALRQIRKGKKLIQTPQFSHYQAQSTSFDNPETDENDNALNEPPNSYQTLFDKYSFDDENDYDFE